MAYRHVSFGCALVLVLPSALTLLPIAASAAETMTYTYDALGRLVVVKSTGTVNNNKTQSYCFDKAGNRIEFDSNSSGTPAACVTQG